MNRNTPQHVPGLRLALAAALLSVAALAATPVVVAQGAIGPPDGPPTGMRPGRHGGGPEAMLGRLGERLGLSDAQKQSIKGILQSARPEMESVREQLRANRERLESTAPDSPTYQAVVDEVSRKTGELTARMVANGAQVQAQVWNVLTPAQRTQAAELRKEMRERMQQRMKQRGMGPMGSPPGG